VRTLSVNTRYTVDLTTFSVHIADPTLDNTLMPHYRRAYVMGGSFFFVLFPSFSHVGYAVRTLSVNTRYTVDLTTFSVHIADPTLDNTLMPHYRRAYVMGGSFFFVLFPSFRDCKSIENPKQFKKQPL
jgi:hypothetical protein